ncbi:MAG: ABC transporter ATP-binding protein, partial [Pseudomonadota bacterium]
LSGGQQQRVALARALMTRPSALLLDEPLSALDPFLRLRVRAELKRLQGELGITFVHVTHSQDEALALADLVIVMNRGQIEQAGPARAVFDAPRTEFVARFIGGHNVLQDGAGRFAIRSDRLTLGSADEGLAATVTAVEYLGAQVSVTLRTDTDEPLTVMLGDRVFFDAPINPGDAVRVGWQPEDAHRLAA